MKKVGFYDIQILIAKAHKLMKTEHFVNISLSNYGSAFWIGIMKDGFENNKPYSFNTTIDYEGEFQNDEKAAEHYNKAIEYIDTLLNEKSPQK